MSGSDFRTKQERQRKPRSPSTQTVAFLADQTSFQSAFSPDLKNNSCHHPALPSYVWALKYYIAIVWFSSVSSILLNSIFRYKVRTRLSVYCEKSTPRGNNYGFPLLGHLYCWLFVVLGTQFIFSELWAVACGCIASFTIIYQDVSTYSSSLQSTSMWRSSAPIPLLSLLGNGSLLLRFIYLFNGQHNFRLL